jgi:hypothetical protein
MSVDGSQAANEDQLEGQQSLKASRKANGRPHTSTELATLPSTRSSTPPSPVLVLAAGAAAGTALYLLIRQLRRSSRGHVRRAPVNKNQVFAAVLALREPSVPLPPHSGASLSGCTLVLSDRLAVQSLQTRFGCSAWKEDQKAAQHTYGPADLLVAAGAHGVAVVHGEALGLG